MSGKRGEEECCDSGLGSFLEGQLWSLPGSQDPIGSPRPCWQTDLEERFPEEDPQVALAPNIWCSGEEARPKSFEPWPSSAHTPEPKHSKSRDNDEEIRKGCNDAELERFDSALGESLQDEDGASGDLSELALSVQNIQLQQQQVDPWAGRICSYISEEGDTALHLAVIHEHEAFLDAVLQYMERTEFLDLQNDLGQTALHIAVILGLSIFASKLVLAGAKLCIPEKAGNTVLHLACKEGKYSCAEVILSPTPENKSEVQQLLDCTNYESLTALHIAVIQKDLKMVKLLLASGADLNKQELSCGRSPLHLAVESQSPEVVECLLQAGADQDAQMYVGYTPMYSAMYRPDQRILQLLRLFGSKEPEWDSEESLDMSSDYCPPKGIPKSQTRKTRTFQLKAVSRFTKPIVLLLAHVSPPPLQATTTPSRLGMDQPLVADSGSSSRSGTPPDSVPDTVLPSGAGMPEVDLSLPGGSFLSNLSFLVDEAVAHSAPTGSLLEQLALGLEEEEQDEACIVVDEEPESAANDICLAALAPPVPLQALLLGLLQSQRACLQERL